MHTVKIQNEQILIDAYALEPLPSIVKWIQEQDLDSEKAGAWLNLLVSTPLTVVDECLDTISAIAILLLANLKDYSIGLIKYATATGKAGSTATATATVQP